MDYYVILNHILSIWSLTDKLSKKDKTIGKPHDNKQRQMPHIHVKRNQPDPAQRPPGKWTLEILMEEMDADGLKLSLPLHQFALSRPFRHGSLLATVHFLLCILLALLQQFIAQIYPGLFYQQE